MKNLINIYKVFFYITIIISLLFAFNLIKLWSVNKSNENKFSAVRVSEDIEIISKDHHSIEHPNERREVKTYLYNRLNELGGNPRLFDYDSIKCKFGGYFDISNIYAEFNPIEYSDSTKYVLLVAHYDSRFHNIVRGDTVYSYGAADDGYGLGVILESVKIALRYKNEWNQGIKVLFTDSEEHELDGMYNAIHYNEEIFDNVNFVINIEARGVKGDALLFETSSNNSAVMDLYKSAKHKRGFSLTTFVYSILPNDTDFTHIKDSIGGLNFAVIDNLDYYHTDKDCFENICLSSIQHYGEQISPIIKFYLLSPIYGKHDAFKANEGCIFFAFPLLGMFIFTYKQYLLLNIITGIFFLLALSKLFIKYRITFNETFKSLLEVSLIAILSLAGGLILSYVMSLIYEVPFNIISLKYIPNSGLISLSAFVLLYISIWKFIQRKNRESVNYFFNLLASILLALFILSVAFFVIAGENFFVLLQLLIASIAIILSFRFSRRIVILSSVFLVSLITAYFIYQLYLAITIGALCVLMFLSSFTIFLIVALYHYYNDCYNKNFI